jgi:hypothetical protein
MAAKAPSPRESIRFFKAFGLSSKALDPANPPIRRLESGSSAPRFTEKRPAGNETFRSGPVAGVKGALGPRHYPQNFCQDFVPSTQAGESIASRGSP